MSWSLLKLKRESHEFFLTLLCIIGFFALGAWKSIDVTNTIVLLLTAFLTARTASKATAIVSSGRDEKSNTQSVIRDLEGIDNK